MRLLLVRPRSCPEPRPWTLHVGKSARLERSLPAASVWLLVCAALTLSACSPQHTAAKRFIKEFNCANVMEKQSSRSNYRIRGCGMVATYTCINRHCIKESERDESSLLEPARQPKQPSVVRGENGNGDVLLALAIEPEKWGPAYQTLHRASFTAVPVAYPDQLRLRVDLAQPCSNCQARLAINGEAAAVEMAATSGPAAQLDLTLTPAVVDAIATSHRAVFRFGKLDWDLTDRERAALRELMIRFREERALSDTPSSSGAETPSERL